MSRDVIAVGADDWDYIKQMKAEERADKEPTRYEYAVNAIVAAGHSVGVDPKHPDKCIIVDRGVYFWPYTGWYQGKGLQGRGIKNFLKAIN